jgi:hypothetical protein
MNRVLSALLIFSFSSLSFATSDYPEIIRGTNNAHLTDQEIISNCSEYSSAALMIKILGKQVADNYDDITQGNKGAVVYEVSKFVGNKWTNDVFSQVTNVFCRLNVTFTVNIAKFGLEHFAACNSVAKTQTYGCVLAQFRTPPRSVVDHQNNSHLKNSDVN